MDGLKSERDIRNTGPNQSGDRLREFRKGWRKAAEGETYREETLKELAWHNLGYRLGKIFGPTSEEMIEAQYDWCVRQRKNAER